MLMPGSWGLIEPQDIQPATTHSSRAPTLTHLGHLFSRCTVNLFYIQRHSLYESIYKIKRGTRIQFLGDRAMNPDAVLTIAPPVWVMVPTIDPCLLDFFLELGKQKLRSYLLDWILTPAPKHSNNHTSPLQTDQRCLSEMDLVKAHRIWGSVGRTHSSRVELFGSGWCSAY